MGEGVLEPHGRTKCKWEISTDTNLTRNRNHDYLRTRTNAEINKLVLNKD